MQRCRNRKVTTYGLPTSLVASSQSLCQGGRGTLRINISRTYPLVPNQRGSGLEMVLRKRVLWPDRVKVPKCLHRRPVLGRPAPSQCYVELDPPLPRSLFKTGAERSRPQSIPLFIPSI